MRTARLVTTFTVAGALGAFFACSDSAKPLGTSDKFIDDTAGQDVSAPPPPGPTDSGGDGADGYGPTVIACAGCSCDPAKDYCFSGGSGSGTVGEGGSGADDASDGASTHRPAVPLGGFGEPDGAAEAGPPPPPCPVVAAGAIGCIPLPTACAATPTCPCLLDALQMQYPACYLVCTPTPGFLSVYCGG
jgi:hypothetical protein